MTISPAPRSSRFRLLRRFAGGLVAVAALSLPVVSSAATVGSDKASNYTSWTNGSNGGMGFGAWDLTSNSGSANDGYFLGDSTAGSGNINTGGQSFGMFAHDTTFANASRAFSSALSLNQTFSIQLAVAFRNGNKGLNLLSGATQVFNFNVGSNNGTDGYFYTVGTGTAVDTGFAYDADSVFTLAYTQQSATAGLFTISRTSASGGAAASNSVSVMLPSTSGVNSFTLYNSNTADSSNQNNLYFNNLTVVPEPSAIALVAVGLTGLVVARRRR